MLLWVRALNVCVLAVLGALVLSPYWMSSHPLDRQLLHYFPEGDADRIARARLAWGGGDGMAARLRELRVQIRDDFCSRSGMPSLRARFCAEKNNGS